LFLLLDLNLRKTLVKSYVWGIALYGVGKWALRKVHQKYRASFETSCWRRKEISWADRVGNEVVLHRVKKERNNLYTVKIRKVNCIGHVLRRNCLLIRVTEEICKDGSDEKTTKKT